MKQDLDYDMIREEISKTITETSKINSETRLQSLLFTAIFMTAVITITKLFL